MIISNKIIIIVIGAIGLYASFLLFSDFKTLSTEIHSFKIQYLPIILLLVPCGWFSLYVRWTLLLKNSGIKPAAKKNLLIFLSGYALDITPGRVGQLIKSQLLKSKFDVPYKTTAPLVLVEKVYDMVGAVAASLLGVWIIGIGTYVILAAMVLLVIGFIVISSRVFFNKFILIFGKLKFVSKIVSPLSDSYEIVRRSCRGKIVVFASVLSFLAWIIESLAVYFVLMAFGIDSVNYLNIISTYATSLILGAASFIPGGLGVTEGSLVGLLSLQGVKISSTLTPVVVIRIVTLWYSVIVGFFALKLIGGLSLKNET